MSEKYRNTYRIASTRLQHWHYGSAAAYFITICTANREHFFGEVEKGKMVLSPTGVIADLLWYEIRNHAKDVDLGSFVVMPNHVHGILMLNGPDRNVNVETRHALSLHLPPHPIGKHRFQNQGKNTLSSIIGSYKSAVTKHANRLRYHFAWQSRFYDHIIRNEKSFETIHKYIVNNPTKWSEDRFF